MRNKLIKMTAVIDFIIIILGLYTTVNIPEHQFFGAASFILATIWLYGYIAANYFEVRDE